VFLAGLAVRQRQVIACHTVPWIRLERGLKRVARAWRDDAVRRHHLHLAIAGVNFAAFLTEIEGSLVSIAGLLPVAQHGGGAA